MKYGGILVTDKQALLQLISDRCQYLQKMADAAITQYVQTKDVRRLAAYNDYISRRKGLDEA